MKTTTSSVSAFSRPPIITLLTDFGTGDYFVAAMKGVILSRSPNVEIVDITHDIPAHDIEAGAFVLLGAFKSFPAGTIHLAVVDPGVGSSRKPILISAAGQFFVGPDNGLFSYVCDRVRISGVYHLTNEDHFCRPVSSTFNGRDIFAPVAAALANGVTPQELGPEISAYVKLPELAPLTSRAGIAGRIIHIDRFGNCVTNISRAELNSEKAAGVSISIKGKELSGIKKYFAEANGEEVFAVWGSAGYLEIAVANGSAAQHLNAKRGDNVTVSFSSSKQDEMQQADQRHQL